MDSQSTMAEGYTQIEYKELWRLERIEEAARELYKVLCKFDSEKRLNNQLVSNLSAKTRKCMKKDLK